jgi:hypothetical protein
MARRRRRRDGGEARWVDEHLPRLVVTPPRNTSPMDLGPVIRILENVPAALPAEREPTPARPEPAPAKEPTPA